MATATHANNAISAEQRKNARRIVRKLINGSLAVATQLNDLPDTGPLLEVIGLLLDNYQQAGASVIPDSIKALSDDYPILIELTEEAKRENEFSSNFLEFKDLALLPKPEWLIYDVLPTKGINFLVSEPKKGKTYVAISQACTVAIVPSGNDTLDALDSATLNWCGRATRHGHVVYIAAEDIDEVAQRVIGWAKYHKVSDLPQFHFFKCPLHLATDTPRFMDAIDEHYENADIKLIVVDTLAMCSMGVEENSKKDFDSIIASIESLWRTYNCCVLVIHHSGRNGKGARGTSAMDGVAYSLMEVLEVDEHLVLRSTLKRRGKKFDDIHLDRQIVELGYVDEEGKPATTCVLTKSDYKPDGDAERLTKLQQSIVDVVIALGGKKVSRKIIMKEMDITKMKERSFINATNVLIDKNILITIKEGRDIFYDIKTSSNGTKTDNSRKEEDLYKDT